LSKLDVTRKNRRPVVSVNRDVRIDLRLVEWARYRAPRRKHRPAALGRRKPGADAEADDHRACSLQKLTTPQVGLGIRDRIAVVHEAPPRVLAAALGTSGFAQGGLGAATSDGGTRLTIERDQQVHESIGRDGKIMRSGLTESTDGTKYLNLSRRRPRVDSDACLRDNRQPNAVIIAMRRAAVCVLLVAALRAPTDARAVDLRNVLTGYALASWTEGEGRSLGEVSAIVQDVSGYLWLGTNTGLIRFDGWRFTRWETISREPLPRSRIVALCVARDGVLWVLFADGAVRQIKDNKVLAAPPANLERPWAMYSV